VTIGNTGDAKIDGKMNLAISSKNYPVPADLKFKGNLKCGISQRLFDMASIEKTEV